MRSRTLTAGLELLAGEAKVEGIPLRLQHFEDLPELLAELLSKGGIAHVQDSVAYGRILRVQDKRLAAADSRHPLLEETQGAEVFPFNMRDVIKYLLDLSLFLTADTLLPHHRLFHDA